MNTNNLICKLATVLFIVAATFTLAAGNGKTKVTTNKKGEQSNYVSKVINNGKILSDKGVNSIDGKDILGIRVSNDTVFFELKKESVSRLDKDKSNYLSSKSK